MYTVFYGKYQPIVNELPLKVIQPSNFGAKNVSMFFMLTIYKLGF